jgi:holin-like protein
MRASSFLGGICFLAKTLYHKGVGVLNFHLSLQNVMLGAEVRMKKILKIAVQTALIYIIYSAGNLISRLISNVIFVPGNIIGMVILLILLSGNIIKLSMIEEASNFMLKYMGFFFVPITIGIMESYKLIQDSIFQIIIILFISCILVMYVTCKVTDILISYKEKSDD